MRGEIDARSEVSLSIFKRHPEWVEKGMANLHAVIEIPKGKKIPQFTHLPDIETFARTDKERSLITMFQAAAGHRLTLLHRSGDTERSSANSSGGISLGL